MIFKLEKMQEKRKTHGKSKSKTSKLNKNRKQSKWGKKGTSKRDKNGEKMDLSICIFFGIVFAFSICILFAFILFFFFGGGFLPIFSLFD
jgi:hypothetical protein